MPMAAPSLTRAWAGVGVVRTPVAAIAAARISPRPSCLAKPLISILVLRSTTNAGALYHAHGRKKAARDQPELFRHSGKGRTHFAGFQTNRLCLSWERRERIEPAHTKRAAQAPPVRSAVRRKVLPGY